MSSFLDWKGAARYLKLNDSEVNAVESDGRDKQDKRHKTLHKWKSKFAFKATYRNLIQALLDSGKGDHAEEVCKLLQKGKHKLSTTVLGMRFSLYSDTLNCVSFDKMSWVHKKLQQLTI